MYAPNEGQRCVWRAVCGVRWSAVCGGVRWLYGGVWWWRGVRRCVAVCGGVVVWWCGGVRRCAAVWGGVVDAPRAEHISSAAQAQQNAAARERRTRGLEMALQSEGGR